MWYNPHYSEEERILSERKREDEREEDAARDLQKEIEQLERDKKYGFLMFSAQYNIQHFFSEIFQPSSYSSLPWKIKL